MATSPSTITTSTSPNNSPPEPSYSAPTSSAPNSSTSTSSLPIQDSTNQIDPSLAPFHTLKTKIPGQAEQYTRMPAIGLGTFGSDHITPEQVAQAVHTAAKMGYRHFDCAAVYGNETQIGQTLQQITQGSSNTSSISRQELFITSKLWNDKHHEYDVIPAFKQTLANLKLDYLDLYLIHCHFQTRTTVAATSPQDPKPPNHIFTMNI